MYNGKVIICDDEVEILRYLSKILSAKGLELEVFSSGTSLMSCLENRGLDDGDLMLLDVKMPDLDGLEILQRVKRMKLDVPVVMMTAYASINSAIEAMKLGAYDYVTKPFPKEKIFGILEKVLERKELLKENIALKDELGIPSASTPLIFTSETFRRVHDMAMLVAQSESNVVILGESGTGKELIASLIHNNSPRAKERFLTINCAALSDTLLESQLFGHIKGAFTGAITAQKGLLEAANHGTLFLDEVGDMSPAIQAKLLRVLQEGDFIPVGDTKAKSVDIRFLAATNKDLEEEVRQKRFREDLFFRLNVISLHLPPLRDRGEDIELLARHFLAKYAARMKREITDFTREAMQLLKSYNWPGNIRELENAIERAAILTRGSTITAETLPVWRTPPPQEAKQEGGKRLVSLETVEREHILHVLKASGNNKSRAAKILEIARRTLDRKIEEYGLEDEGVR
ncbi:sigma-54 dependent transcriptional regulator [Geomonas nitrogeniifigens]|uniref:DNA-binding transcriptional regulator NtrC n=1 Tax=Geomonas diazotrophica TaxID=2843197 RepID=A0ABX8JP11_9BACT|nr:sigma-54 dependent transcriptional regulator [Geomonas nitrogeniifigens]QWV99448.1 sigma-54 dependent transcriptional regulator [Geomonas nitrogeniifigens]QXE88624.1 sigma-54 dependent transcriptional regulator [Geomonas nitrogeniifigens]